MGAGILPQKQKPGKTAEKILRQRTGGAGTIAEIIGLNRLPFAAAGGAFVPGLFEPQETQQKAIDGNQKKTQNAYAPGETTLDGDDLAVATLGTAETGAL